MVLKFCVKCTHCQRSFELYSVDRAVAETVTAKCPFCLRITRAAPTPTRLEVVGTALVALTG